MIPLPSLADRVRALTPLQRALLVRRLNRDGATGSPAQSGGQLVAYVVPASGRSVRADEVRDALRARVPEYMVPSAFVVLDDLPRTPNGKVDRRALPTPSAEAERSGGLAKPQSPVEQQLADIWSEVLRMDRIDVNDNFFEIGGDSISSIQIIARANRAGIQLKPSLFFDHPTIAALARVATTAQDERDEETADGPVPLTPIQRWFFDQDLPDPRHWNQVLALDVARGTDLGQLEAAFRAALQEHDAFRLRYRQESDGWTQHLVSPNERAMEVVRHDGPGQSIADIQAASQDALDLEAGPLVRADLVDRGEGSVRLVLTVHHLVIDVLSWPILLGDVERAYADLQAGRMPDLARSRSSFGRWALALQDEAEALATDSAYWLEQARQPVASLSTDGDGPNTEQTAQTLTRQLNASETAALMAATATYGMKPNELVLTALAIALADASGDPSVRVDLEGHGREDLYGLPDASGAVGWFTSLYPVVLRPAAFGGSREALIHVKEALRAVPRKGIGYGILRYMSASERRRQLEAAPAEVLFNYMGQSHPTFGAASPFQAPVELTGSRGAEGTRAHLIEINASIDEGALKLNWTYSTSRHHRETIEHMVEDTQAALETLVRHCQAPDAGAYTASDFPDVDLSQGDLDALLGDFD